MANCQGERNAYPQDTGTAPVSRWKDDEVAKKAQTVTVQIAGEHRAVAWSDGVFAGDPDLVDESKRLAAINARVEVAPPGGYGTATDQTRQGAMVAMLGAAKGRGLVVEQDDELWEGLLGESSPGDIC